MTSRPTPSEPDDRAAQRAEDTQYYRAVLHELIEIGADLARALRPQATQEQTPADQPAPESQPTQPAADPTVAFERVARTIRRTIALARTLDEPATPARPVQDAPRVRAANRERVIREVEDVIQRRAEGADAAALRAELHERLTEPEFDDDLAGQPIADVIQLLLRDLGIAATFPGNRPWTRRTPADVRDLRARAAKLAAAAQSAAARPPAAAPTREHPASTRCPANPLTTPTTGPPPA